MSLRWLFSGTVRQAGEMCKQARKLVNAHRDLLSPQALAAVEGAIAETRAAIDGRADNKLLTEQMTKLEETTAKWIKPYPNADWRENIEVFLVAIVVAMAIRTFFLQPFKIPTGSMEPTLYGIETQDLRDEPDFKMPGMLGRIWDACVYGRFYHEIIATNDVENVRVDPIGHIAGFINKQKVWVTYSGNPVAVPYTIWFGPDSNGPNDNLATRAGLEEPRLIQKGEPIIRLEEHAGDHLFVDRFTYNFRHPHRGEIVVFMTKGIAGIQNQDQFYIKRLIGLPGETVSIGEDQHVRINGRRLDASTPHFENVYGFDPTAPQRTGNFGQYNGHVLEPHQPNCLLRTPDDSIQIPPGDFVVCGDNTLNSYDSRYWGPLSERNVIGKSFLVYWPVTPRFGWNNIKY